MILLENVHFLFSNRKAAIDWMREQGCQYEDIEIMQSKLKIRWLEDHPSVPPGWKTRKSKIKTNVSTGFPTEMKTPKQLTFLLTFSNKIKIFIYVTY